MRGCVNRFLLFGLDEDVRDALTDKSECRTTDRRLLHLVALTPQTDLVYIFELNCTVSIELSVTDKCSDNVLMYGLAMQSCKHGLRPVDRCFFCMQRIPSDSYADFSLCSAHLDHISLVKTTIPDAAPAQPAAVSQENKDEVKEKGKNDEQKNKEKTKTEGEKEKEKKDEEKKDEEKKDEEKTDKERKDEGKKDEEKKDEEKSKEKKRNDLEEAKAKDDRETEKRDKKDSEVKEAEIKKVEDKKEEDLKKDAENPIVTPVSDEDENTDKNKGLDALTDQSRGLDALAGEAMGLIQKNGSCDRKPFLYWRHQTWTGL
ncbi:unnamed protein product [Onchocerca ochengi]|uniref:MNN4 n=1 Tax=Onchocerca ochengi TaxID=42157 RepID=A0A182EDD3_ONCOC|nr:unnamed protein product [Onchocerca ochengi]